MFNSPGLSFNNFDPTQIPNLKLWLDATDPAGNRTQPADNSSLATWVDKSRTSNSAAQVTASKQPLFKTNIQNGKPSVRFDGVDDWMVTPNIINSSDFTLFEVKRVLTPADTRGVYWYNGSDQGFYSANQFAYEGVYFSSPVVIIQNAGQPSGFFIQTHRKASTTASIWLNGVSQNSDTVNAAAQNAYLTIGADYTGGGCGNQDYSEIIFYPHALTNTQLTYVVNYLKNKWGIV